MSRHLTAALSIVALSLVWTAPAAAGERFAPGTELYVRRDVAGTHYHHAGVYVGGDSVVHVFAEPRGAVKDLLSGDAIVHIVKTSLAKFADGDAVAPGPTKTTFPPEVAVERALAMVGNGWKYDPLRHNCQHFSSERVSGVARSPEAQAIQRATIGGLQAAGHAVESAGETVLHGAEAAEHTVEDTAKEGWKKFKGLFHK